jgi:hypothetical protein
MRAKIMLLLLAFRSYGMTLPMQAKDMSSQVPTRASATGDDLALKLSKRVSNYNLGVSNLVEALIRVSNEFQIPMGIAWVNSPSARAEMPFAWKDATIEEIIHAIANTQPGYQAQVRNGVLHVSPTGLIPDAENFLKIKIDGFTVHDTYVEVASFKLHTLVTPIKGSRQISIAGPGDSRVTVELKDATVEEALDALSVASNRKIWVVTFADDATLSPRGLRRTGSLWSRRATPDQEQPSWDLLRWGDPMPPAIARSRGQQIGRFPAL